MGLVTKFPFSTSEKLSGILQTALFARFIFLATVVLSTRPLVVCRDTHTVVQKNMQVEESLNFIQELMEKKESDVVKVVSVFPESFAIGVEDGPPGLKYASNFIEDSWKMKGKA